MDLSQMDLKEKILLGGGGALVLFFLFKSIAGRGGSAPAPVVDQGKIEQDLGNQVAGAVGQAADQFNQSNQAAIAAIQKSNQDTLAAVGKSNQDTLAGITQMFSGLQNNFAGSINAIQKSITDQGAAQQHEIDALNQSTQSLLNGMASQISHIQPAPAPSTSGGSGSAPATNLPVRLNPLGGDLGYLTNDQLRARAAADSAAWFNADAKGQSDLHNEKASIEGYLHPGQQYNSTTGKWSA